MRILLLLTTVIVIAITIALALKKSPRSTQEVTQKISQDTLQREVQAVQQQLPISVDAFTELNNIEVTEMEIKYSFNVTDGPTQNFEIRVNDESFAQQVETEVKVSACLN
ncbi:MAG: hypothetical protein P8X88_05545, partial [Gammaproteobacteria bacterium]